MICNDGSINSVELNPYEAHVEYLMLRMLVTLMKLIIVLLTYPATPTPQDHFSMRSLIACWSMHDPLGIRI